MAAAIAGNDARARQHLTRFLALYRSPDTFTQNARRALEALDRPRAQRTVSQGSDGSIMYYITN
jgi:spore coat polysaccharide biosynthesis protein SpsF (cytidylyltransferase family)